MRTFEQQHTVKKNQLIKLLDAYAYDEIDNIRSMLVNKSITLSAILDQYGLVLLSGVCNAHLHAGIQDICLENCSGQETNYYRDIAKTKFAAMVTFLAILMLSLYWFTSIFHIIIENRRIERAKLLND